MSLFGTKVYEHKRGPRGVWPYFFLSLACLTTYLFCVLALWPWGYPGRDELVPTGGKIARIIIRDHISDTGAGSMLPTHVSVYLSFKGLDGEFEFPWSHPQYHLVRDRVGVYANILIEKASLDGPGPYKIWALEEVNKFKPAEDQIIVPYDEIASTLDGQQKTLATMLKWLGGGTVVFASWGWYMIRWNRRNYPPIQ
jgi:hypothetical protein